MRTTTNLELTVWDQGTDLFNREAFADNWDAIDGAIFVAKQVEILAAVPVTDNFAGRVVMLSADDSDFKAWSLIRYNGSGWNVVGGVEIHGSLPGSGNFAGRCVLLTAASGVIPAYTIYVYTGTAWRPIDTVSIYKNEILIGTRQNINFKAGDNVIIDSEDDADNQRVNVKFNADNPTAALSVKKNGSLVGSRSQVEFITGSNSILGVTDVPADEEVKVSVGTQFSGSPSTNPIISWGLWNPLEISNKRTTTYWKWTGTPPKPTRIEPTFLRATFTAPGSGKVVVRLSGVALLSAQSGGNAGLGWCLADENGNLITGTLTSIIATGNTVNRISLDIPLTGLVAGNVRTVYWAQIIIPLFTPQPTTGAEGHLFAGGRGDGEGDVAGPATIEVWSV